tara:strand:- start:1099 stop:1599 length:501 start_codon:yes stop_codon:yes gene_type:complete
METSNIYSYINLSKTIGLLPRELNNDIDATILYKLKEEIEGKCISEGYVMPHTLSIINRSLGQALVSHFNGNVIYNINYSVKVCNPLEGNIIEATVVNVNKMGAMANSGQDGILPLNILLAKQHHIDNETFESLKEGNKIMIKVLGKRFDSGEDQISVIGLLEKKL